jgi:hypothetical protein
MTMNTMKTLMLAGITALSLGTGNAMAQEGGSDYPATPDYWAPSSIAARNAKHVQAGSSDADTLRSGSSPAFSVITNQTGIPNLD